jgi:photosystem II stability/assembly factor-like uncharacterized protein
MKKLAALLFAISFITITANAQSANRNLHNIRKKFYTEFERLERQGKIEKEEKDGDGLMQQFRRWEYLMRSRTFPSGDIPDGAIQWREWQRYQNMHATQFERIAAQPQWQQVGTNVVPSLGGGAGRINVIRLAPNNTNIIYIGSAGGGVWKTTDGGTTWATTTDKYPVTSIADIAIDATNPNNIYVATGDGAGYEVDDDFWGGVYTAGILRSTDGGTTWSQVAKTLPQDMRNILQRLIINPSNPNVLLAATRAGIYRTTNAGTSWKKVSNNHCYDMEWNTANASIVYAGGEGVVYKSTDAGATWSSIKTGLGSGRMSIEVSASNAQVIYALTGSSFQRTTDGGATWTTRSYPSGAGFYGYYDLVLSCAGANSDYLIAGGLTTVKSTNGGSSWTSVDNWSNYTAPNYVHADKHFAMFYPASTTNIMVGCDGGVFRTTNGGTNWSDLSNGLMIAQVYRIGITPQNVNLITSGWQDNGCNKWDGTNWTQIFGADGMETAIDYTNQNTIYESYQYGSLNRSYNGGSSWTYIAPGSGDWITPFVIDPSVNTRLYYGGSNILYKTENQGNSWSAINGVNFGDYGEAIAIAPSNNNIVYSASFGKIFRTNIVTNTSTDITAGLPVTKAAINYIAVSSANANHVWVALSGYTAGEKVYRTTNGGASWANISGSLPNLPVNTIAYQNNSTGDRVFIGTDIGVFATDNAHTDWQRYGAKLPNVMVHELEINYTNNKLVAATYGRGIWRVDIPGAEPQPIAKTNGAELNAKVFPNPTTGIVNVQVQNAKSEVLLNVYKLTGEKVASYHYNAEAAKTIKIDLTSQPFGNYIIHLQSGEATITKAIQLNK